MEANGAKSCTLYCLYGACCIAGRAAPRSHTCEKFRRSLFTSLVFTSSLPDLRIHKKNLRRYQINASHLHTFDTFLWMKTVSIRRESCESHMPLTILFFISTTKIRFRFVADDNNIINNNANNNQNFHTVDRHFE